MVSASWQLPVYTDSTDPKVYRSYLYEWIRFQDLSDESSSKYLTLLQRVFSITSNIQGSAGHRLGSVAGLLLAYMNRDEYIGIVDYKLEIFDHRIGNPHSWKLRKYGRI